MGRLKKLDKEDVKEVATYLPREVVAQLEKQAKDEGRSMSRQMRRMIEKDFNKKEKT
jgi:predicted DNA-binding protein